MVRLVHGFRRNAAKFAEAGFNVLFPPRCAACDAELAADGDALLLCADCRVLLGPKSWPCCPRCGASGVSRDGRPTCPLCAKSRMGFDAVVPLGSYSDQLRKVVLQMKRPAHDALSAAMGRLLALRRGRELADLRADVIVPIPMYWRRRLARRTNSPEIVAHRLGRLLGISVRRRVLLRCRNTLPQADLSPTQRFRNVRGAFRVPWRGRLEGVRVLLVDDVLTTGATCSEAARMLKRAGASMVAAAVVARAQGPRAT